MAARHGHLDVLQWARANGCDWDAETWEAAVEGGDPAILQWLHDNGCPGADVEVDEEDEDEEGAEVDGEEVDGEDG